MINKKIEHSTGDGKGKIVIRLQILNKKLNVVKLYQTNQQSYDEALDDAKSALIEMLEKGIKDNRKVKYLIDGRVKEEA